MSYHPLSPHLSLSTVQFLMTGAFLTLMHTLTHAGRYYDETIFAGVGISPCFVQWKDTTWHSSFVHRHPRQDSNGSVHWQRIEGDIFWVFYEDQSMLGYTEGQISGLVEQLTLPCSRTCLYYSRNKISSVKLSAPRFGAFNTTTTPSTTRLMCLLEMRSRYKFLHSCNKQRTCIQLLTIGRVFIYYSWKKNKSQAIENVPQQLCPCREQLPGVSVQISIQ